MIKSCIKNLLVLLLVSIAMSIGVVHNYAQVPTESARIVYVYDAQSATGRQIAESYESVLVKRNIPVDLVDIASVNSQNLSLYKAVIIGQELDLETFDNNENFVVAVEDSNIPVLGIGSGGSALFEKIGLSFLDSPALIDYELISSAILPIRETLVGISQIPNDFDDIPTEEIEISPEALPGRLTTVIRIYDKPVTAFAWSNIADPRFEGLVRGPTTYNVIVTEQERFTIWGFDTDAVGLTEAGERLFVNVVYKVLNTSENCLMSPYLTDGQRRFRFARFTGITSEGAVQPETEPSVWLDNPYNSFGDQQVAILIVDDFTYPEPSTSHGVYIQDLFNRVISASNSPNNIQVATINIADFNYRSRNVAEAIESTAQSLNESSNIDRFVINMSFGMVPCSDIRTEFDFDEYVQWRYNILRPKGPTDNLTFVDYWPAYLGTTLNTREILDLFKGVDTAADPLRNIIMARMFNLDAEFYMIAASGNFGDLETDPFYPARWPEVISVSSNSGTGPDINFVSQNGEVQWKGGWYRFDVPNDVANYQIGTSFAAVLMSTSTAVNLSYEQPLCSAQILKRSENPTGDDLRFKNSTFTDWLQSFSCN